MKSFLVIIFIIFLGLSLGLFVCNYKAEEFRFDAVKTSVSEAVKVAASKSLNKGTRAKTCAKSPSKLDEKIFAEKFEQSLKKSLNTGINQPSVEYDFLQNRNGTAAVKITITDNSGRKYAKIYELDLRTC